MIFPADQLNLPLSAIVTSVELVAEVARWVVEAHFLVNRVDLLEILRFELEVTLQVVSDTRRRLRLWNH